MPKNYQVAKASESQGRRDRTKILTIVDPATWNTSPPRHYAHVDCPGHADYVKNMITGAAQMDGAILVSAPRRPDAADARAHPAGPPGRRAGACRVPQQGGPVDDPELLDLVELEIRELLTSYGFPGDTLPVVRGGAKAALEGEPKGEKTIQELMDAIDAHIPMPMRDIDKPFLMPIEDVFSIEGRGTVVTGRVERGIKQSRRRH